MDIIQWIHSILYKYISIDNIVEYGGIVVLLLVIWSFWGNSAVVRKILKRKKGE